MPQTPERNDPRTDEEFLDELFERALIAAERGSPLPLDAELPGREHLRERAHELVAAAAEIVAQPTHAPPHPAIAGYEIERALGAGSMGSVYLARQTSLGKRRVALKIAPPHVQLAARARARFLAEARALARVRHPAVVEVHDIVESPGLLAYAMEWIDGASLAELIQVARAAPPRGRLAAAAARLGCDPAALGGSWPQFCCAVAIRVARALAAVHAVGLLHRDVKPANVLIDSEGRAHLSDFGLVHDDDASAHTRTGQYLGTPAYSAPEQLRGEHAAVDARSDVYSLGALLYETLGLVRPFDQPSPAAILARAEHGQFTPLRQIDRSLPRDLETIVAKCLAPEREQRYFGAAELADDLERVLRLEPIRARPTGVLGRMVNAVRRNRRVAASAGIAAALAVVPAAWLGARWAGAAERDREAGELQRSAQMALFNPGYAVGFFGADLSDSRGDLAGEASRPAARMERAARLYEQARERAATPGLRREIDLERQWLELAWELHSARASAQSVAPAISPELRAAFPAATAVASNWDGRAAADLAGLPRHELRALGRLGFLMGDSTLAERAWSAVSAVPDSDPFADAALGQRLLFSGQPARAAPRLQRACAVFAQAGFLYVDMADALIQLGEYEAAERWLERGEGLALHDPYDSRTLVRADLAAARGDDEKARELYEWMLDHHRSPAATRRILRFYDSRGDHTAALGAAILLAERYPANVQAQRDLLARAERWRAAHESDESPAPAAAGRAPAQSPRFTRQSLEAQVRAAAQRLEALEKPSGS